MKIFSHLRLQFSDDDHLVNGRKSRLKEEKEKEERDKREAKL